VEFSAFLQRRATFLAKLVGDFSGKVQHTGKMGQVNAAVFIIVV
jgi:hypothetical protein